MTYVKNQGVCDVRRDHWCLRVHPPPSFEVSATREAWGGVLLRGGLCSSDTAEYFQSARVYKVLHIYFSHRKPNCQSDTIFCYLTVKTSAPAIPPTNFLALLESQNRDLKAPTGISITPRIAELLGLIPPIDALQNQSKRPDAPPFLSS